MCVSSCHCDMVRCTVRVLVHCVQVGNIILWFNVTVSEPTNTVHVTAINSHNIWIIKPSYAWCVVFGTRSSRLVQYSSCFFAHFKKNILIFWNRLLQVRTFSKRFFIVMISHFILFDIKRAGPSGRAVYGVGLLPFAWWGRGFESHRGHGRLSVVSVVCFQIEVSVTTWPLVQRSSDDCSASRNLMNEEA